MYVVLPGAAVRALDATTGAVIWEYKRAGRRARAKTIAMYDDMIFYTAPDGFVVALDARTGEVRWETKTAGGIDVGADRGRRQGADRPRLLAAARELLHRRARREDREGGVAVPHRGAATTIRAARPGAARPKRRASPPRGACRAATIRSAGWSIWGIANPMPNTRAARHGGKVDAIPTYAPADLYSNSTVALNPDTGKLAWYYQHLPGDDWDQDYTHERTLVRTAVSPDPKFVKWINPDVRARRAARRRW